MKRPYDNTFGHDYGRGRPVLSFEAPLERFESIGLKGEAILDASIRHAEGRPWRQLVQEEFEKISASPVQSFRFECGGDKVTQLQRDLFDDIEDNQDEYLNSVSSGLQLLFQNTLENRVHSAEQDIIFPADASYLEILDRFAILYIDLSNPERGIEIVFESLDLWLDEHGCVLRIQERQLMPIEYL